MSEIVLTFQSQLSGVMETVFKAAIFEITRLVEDSFLEEVSRSREQVESLKKKLQWCESKGRRRCAECGNNNNSSKVPSEERPEKSAPSHTGTFSYQEIIQFSLVVCGRPHKAASQKYRDCAYML